MRIDTEFLSAGFALVALVATAGEGKVLENEAMRIRFGSESEGFGIREISGTEDGAAAFVAARAGESDFWKVEFLKTDAAGNGIDHFPLTNLSPAESRSVSIQGGNATFLWKGMTLRDEVGCVDVTVQVKLAKAKGASSWTLKVTNRSKEWGYLCSTYPILRDVTRGESADLLIPSVNLGGRLLKGVGCGEFPDTYFPYPSGYLQLVAFMRGDSGLYFAAHDGESRIKDLTLKKNGDVFFRTPAENAGRAGLAADGPRYPVVIALFRGDWWKAAKLYRSWALRQKWAKKGKLAYRQDVAKRAQETDLWITANGKAADVDRVAEGVKRHWPDVKTSLSWGGWQLMTANRFASNRGYPENFPASDTNASAYARKWVSQGLLLLPYTNGRLWDMSLSSFEYAKEDATRLPNGTIFSELYRCGEEVDGRFAVMCPCCPRWQEVVRHNARRVLDDLGANAVYFDQIACARPKGCSNRAHGHPVIGGSWWADGYRQMLEPLRKEFVKRGAVMVSEQLGEVWLDLFDAYLNASQLTAEDVPLFPAVYAGYCVHYGRRRDPYNFTEFARTILWGEAAGWIGDWVVLDERHANSAALHRRLAKFRRAHAEYLVYGSLEDELRPLEPDPDVIGNVWKNADGTKWCVFVSNGSKAAKTVAFRSPASGKTVRLEVASETIGTYETKGTEK